MLASCAYGMSSAMNISMESEIGDQEVGMSKEVSGFSQQMDISQDSDRVGENAVKAELCSPAPLTPMQVAPAPQQKPRETNVSCPNSATTGPTHSFEAAKSSYELQFASGTPQSLPVSTQDAVQSETENAQLLTALNKPSTGGSTTLKTSYTRLNALEDDVGHPLVSGDLVAMGGPTNAVVKEETEMLVAPKTTEDEASMSSCGAVERACSDRSMMSMGRPSFSVKTESAGFTLDAGLSLGSNAVQFSGSKERKCVEFSRIWENVGGGGRSRDSYVGRSREEGSVVLQLSQGGGNAEAERSEVGTGGEWRGKHLQLSLGSDAEEKVEGGRVDGNVEHRFTQVLEPVSCARVEHGAKACTDPGYDPLTKRVKREVTEIRMSLDGSREQIWERNGTQDRKRSGMYESNQEDFRSLFWGNGGAALLPQSYREKAFGRVLDVGSGEPKTMVVKKTPKRVHNSDPSAMFTRSELLMLEDSMRSPGSVPGVMFSPLKKQGMNGSMFPSDLSNFANQHSARKPTNLVCGRERGVEYSKIVHSNSSVHQAELESRLDRASSCSLMSSSKNALLMGEPSLPLSLNFSPKPQRPVVSITRTSTEEEWGKSLALCGPGAESPSEVERSGEEAKALGYQERFVQLQVFLKKCDEDDQSYLLDALRSLSAAGRSSHAVGLEQRALWLSMEEGKEMTRLKSLNVMGQRSSMKGQSEAGCTPQGPRVGAFGRGAEYGQPQSSMNTISPQMQMQMQTVMSGSMAGSGYKERYGSG
ncbi:hypothetical protein KC19_8G175000 [Ceratodon purpureus]|uniref:Uncharacterized protein n=1 Tax=Ceratodon purpureus TaxID=3225 RepID=A0A8T0H508_CERPU|nr:hypothetical protein KC19_8G175000 [Ceratodon purpureus]